MPQRFRIPSLLITLLACAALATSVARAAVPPIMSYSGELQASGGAPFASGTYTMTFSLYTAATGGAPIWTEVHSGVEVAGGSFHVQLGTTQAVALMGLPFDRPYFLGVTVGSDPEMTPRQPLVTLPYAFRAGLADQVANGSVSTEKIAPLAVTDDKIKSVSWAKITGAPVINGDIGEVPVPGSSDGVPANVWSLKGNRKSNPPGEFLGTTDAKDLVIKVNSQTLMNLAVGGPITAITGFEAAGDLGVGGNTTLRGRLDVTGATTLQSTLGVAGATALQSTLGVAGATTLLGPTALQSTLDVTGITMLQNTVNVAANDTGYVMTIVNTENNTGDGLKIKLGKTHPSWTGSGYIRGVDPAEQLYNERLQVLSDWILQHKEPTPEELIDLALPLDLYVGTILNIGNLAIDVLNDHLLPITLPALTLDLNSICPLEHDDCIFHIIGETEIVPELPHIDTSDFPTLELPDLKFKNQPNSLTSANEYIRFTDQDDRVLGAIRAESIEDWSTSYVDYTYLLHLWARFQGVDKTKGILGGMAEFSKITKAYNQIGVAYTSVAGDYAEWLERLDHDEVIAAGDIVAVKGGKITKNMDGAEQVMAVSRHPIVLGNMPPADMEALGHNVAFMGQIPVKVQGPVGVGDYIVARSGIPGYGIAVKPVDMTPEDFRLCVGRSWETQERRGPKVVNTVVGVQNGDFVRILKKTIDANHVLEARMRALEERMDREAGSNAANATFKTASADR